MARIDESGLAGQIRDKPINEKLRQVLLTAAVDSDIDVIRITSGGQPGSSGRRTGSHRHDGGNAADLELVRNNRTLDFTVPADLVTIRRFVTAAAAHGATGIGAGVKYMGPTKLHVGFGNSSADTNRITWGAGGASANAPIWLREAAQRGWDKPASESIWVQHEAWDRTSDQTSNEIGVEQQLFEEGDMAGDPDVERFRPLLDFIALHEGTANQPGGGYNTSLGYGRFLPGGVEQVLVTKTLDDIYELGLSMRRQPGNPNSSALGRYQIVGQTLRGLQKKRGLSGKELYSAQLQDRFATDLIIECRRNAQKLGATWASLKRVNPVLIFAAYDQHGPVIEKPAAVAVSPECLALLKQLLTYLPGQAVTSSMADDLPILTMGASGDEVKRVQQLLNGLRYFTGGDDGKFGKLTRSAVGAFQLDNDLQASGVVDAATWAALVNASARELPEQRVSLTADDLRKLGSRTVKNADWVRYGGWLTGALGLSGLGKSGACALDSSLAACGAQAASATATADSLLQALQNFRSIPVLTSNPNVAQALDTLQQVLQKGVDLAHAAKPAVQPTTSMLGDILGTVLPVVGAVAPGPWGALATLGLGAAFHFLGSNIIDHRVQDQRDGKNIGPRQL